MATVRLSDVGPARGSHLLSSVGILDDLRTRRLILRLSEEVIPHVLDLSAKRGKILTKQLFGGWKRDLLFFFKMGFEQLLKLIESFMKPRAVDGNLPELLKE
jgi:hypothetical protein